MAPSGFHSINIPSEWGPCILNYKNTKPTSSFHSINIPSEWGREILEFLAISSENIVSIQLISPASGD